MASELAVSDASIKKTQLILGSIIKKPALTEKLLRKPPFRFLHDIICGVVKNSGAFSGLYTEEEMVSDNVKEKDAKIGFLEKSISAIGFALTEVLSVKPNKIVAGQESEKTNDMLQKLGKIASDRIDTASAVQRVLAGEKPTSSAKKPKEKVKNEEKRSREKSKDETARKRLDAGDTLGEKGEASGKKDREKLDEGGKKERVKKERDGTNKDKEKKKDKVKSREKGKETDGSRTRSSKNDDEEMGKTKKKLDDKKEKKSKNEVKEDEKKEKKLKSTDTYNKPAKKLPLQNIMSGATGDIDDLTTNNDGADEPSDKFNDAVMGAGADVNAPPPVSNRPFSAKPPLARSRRGTDDVVPGGDEIDVVAPGLMDSVKVNVIIDEDKEDDEFLPGEIHEDEIKRVEMTDVRLQEQLAPGEKGLSQRIIEQSEKLKNGSLMTEQQVTIEMSTEYRKKQRELVNRDISSMRNSVQSLCRAANPLGRSMDYLQEDLDQMAKELEVWVNENLELDRKLLAENSETTHQLEPLRQELVDLEAAIRDQQAKIGSVKARGLRGEERVGRLLLSFIDSNNTNNNNNNVRM